MEPIIKGVLSGLAYGLLIGPLFFMNIRITLSHGIQHGIALVIGAFISDLMLVLGSWWGAARVAEIAHESAFQTWFGLFSGLLLFGFGLSAVWPRKRDYSAQLTAQQTDSKRRYSFLQGFIVNMTNPSNWLFWIGVASAAHAEAAGESENYSRMFMAAALLGLFITDLVKAIIAHQIGRRLKPSLMHNIVRLAGVILMAVSCWILIRVGQQIFG